MFSGINIIVVLTAIAIKDISATTIARTILLDWISVFGVTSMFTIDRGTQFPSTLLKSSVINLELST